MKITRMAVVVAALGMGLTLTACGERAPYVPPCSGLTASDADKAATLAGYEVEKIDSRGYECELTPSGNWTVDD